MWTLKELMELKLSDLFPKKRCPSCEKSIRGETHTLDKKEVCADCYYSSMSEVLDEHPPHGPRKRGH